MKTSHPHVPFSRRAGLLLGLFLLACLVIGFLTVRHYGESVDEPLRIHYAEISLYAYAGKIKDLADEKGTFFIMTSYIGARFLQGIFPTWLRIDGWHLMTYLSYLMGVFFFYRLCKRLVEPIPALAATLLFSTQPLLWGHAFINPKDVPFMAFFCASVSLGLDMVEHLKEKEADPSYFWPALNRLKALPGRLAEEWRGGSRSNKKIFWISSGLLLITCIGYPLINEAVSRVVTMGYTGTGDNWLNQVFSRIAQHSSSVPVEAYIAKAQTLFTRGTVGVLILLTMGLIWSVQAIFPSTAGRALRILFQPQVLAAGCFLGFTSDIRTLGPASALLVGIYFLVKLKNKAIPYFFEYLAVGFLVTYVFWPYLWGDPIHNYWTAVNTSAHFPWYGDNLFNGQYYSGTNLPLAYLPVLIALQFTEPTLILLLCGFILALIHFFRTPAVRWDLLLLGAWFFGPLIAAVSMHSVIYNNFRQFLFVIPPLFVIAAIAFQWLWKRLEHQSLIFSALVVLSLVPAVYWQVKLFPYQYLYYNSLAGGVHGAFKRYDLDYWYTANKEAVEYINITADSKATVLFWDYSFTAEPYARTDLDLVCRACDPVLAIEEQPDFVVIPGDLTEIQQIYPDSPVVFRVERDDATLVVVKKVAPEGPIQK